MSLAPVLATLLIAWTAPAHAHGGEATAIMLGIVVVGLLFPMVSFLFYWRGTLGQKFILICMYVGSIIGSVVLVGALERHTFIFFALLIGVPLCVWADLVLRWRNSPLQGPRIALLAVVAAGAMTWLGSAYRPPGTLGTLQELLQPLVFVPYVVSDILGRTPNSPIDSGFSIALFVQFLLLFWLLLRVWKRIRGPAGEAPAAATEQGR